MQIIAFAIVAMAGLWLVSVAILMAICQRRFLHLLSLTASTWRVNVIEQGLRLLAGMALVVRSESAKMPGFFEIGGWFIIISSVVLLVMPLRLHAAYAIWWSRKLPPWMVRAIAPVSAIAGIGLIYAASPQH